MSQNEGEHRLKVSIKKFDVAMEVKTSGIELDVYDNNGDHLGDLVVTKTKLIWCAGKVRSENGKTITWQHFIDFMNQRP